LAELAHNWHTKTRSHVYEAYYDGKTDFDPDGKITIPPKVIQKRGLHPGDELALVEAPEGLLVYQGGVDDKTSAWWNRLDDGQRLLAETEARRYENLSDKVRDSIWNEEADSIEAESDEIDLRPHKRRC